MDILQLKRRLKRLRLERDQLDEKYTGNEREYTFHAGFNLGYVKGKIAELEDTLDELGEEI